MGDFPHDLTVHGADGTGYYTFKVAPGGGWRARANTESPDRLHQNGRRASGRTKDGGEDSYKFAGVIEDANFDGAIKSVEINGKHYDPGSVVKEWQRDAGVYEEYNGGDSSPGNGGGSPAPDPSSGGSSSVEERRQLADADGEVNKRDTVIRNDGDLRQFINDIDVPTTKSVGAALADGVYTPGALQRTLLSTRPAHEVDLVGNVDDPRTVQIRSNCNFNNLLKDEHFALRGLTMARTQLAGTGDPYVRDCSFTDRWGKSHSAIGGKPATGRFIDCEIGHAGDPDDYAMYYFGGGEVLLDRGNELVARKAYIGAANQVTLNIHPSTKFESGPKEVVEGSGIKPGDLHDGRMTVIKNGEIIN